MTPHRPLSTAAHFHDRAILIPIQVFECGSQIGRVGGFSEQHVCMHSSQSTHTHSGQATTFILYTVVQTHSTFHLHVWLCACVKVQAAENKGK